MSKKYYLIAFLAFLATALLTIKYFTSTPSTPIIEEEDSYVNF